MKFSWRDLTPQLFIVFVFPLTVLLFIFTFGGLRLHQSSMRVLVGERDVRAARAAAAALAEQIVHRITMIQELTLRIGSDATHADLNQVLRDSDHLVPDFDKGLAFYDQQLGLLQYQGDVTFWENLDMTSIQAEELVFEPEEPVKILHTDYGSPSAPVVMVISSPTLNQIVVVGAFSPSNMIRAVLEDVFDPSDGGLAFVINQKRQILFEVGNRANPDESLQDHPGVRDALDGNSGSTYRKFQNDEHVVAYSSVEPVNWALIIEEPWNMVASPLLRLTEYAPLVLIPILIVALLALWFGTNRIVQPLRLLEERASALGWGDFDSIGVPVGGISEIRYLQSELIQLAKKVKAAQQGLRGYIGVMTQGLEEERARLARELHDDTLQSLIALNQRIHLALLTKTEDSDKKNLLEIQHITENTIQDLRRVTRALRPIYLEDLGLTSALEMLARETQNLHGLQVEFERDGLERRLDENVELALYRIVQESLSNVVRHANAKFLSVSISFTDADVCVEVSDSGKGFVVPDSPSAFAPSGHYGLLGIFERAELIRAKLSIQSKPGVGTKIAVTLPNQQQTGPVEKETV